MRVKLLKKCTVGKPPRARRIGWVGEVEDDEAKALVQVGYAKETKEELTVEPSATVAGEFDGERKAEKAKGDAPNNKAK